MVDHNKYIYLKYYNYIQIHGDPATRFQQAKNDIKSSVITSLSKSFGKKQKIDTKY